MENKRYEIVIFGKVTDDFNEKYYYLDQLKSIVRKRL